MADIAVLGLTLDYSKLDAGARQAGVLLDTVEGKFESLDETNKKIQRSLDAGVATSLASLSRQLNVSEREVASFVQRFRVLDTDFDRRAAIFKAFGLVTRDTREDLFKLANQFDQLGVKAKKNTEVIAIPGSGKAPGDTKGADVGGQSASGIDRLSGAYRTLRGEAQNVKPALDLVTNGIRTGNFSFGEAITTVEGLTASLGPLGLSLGLIASGIGIAAALGTSLFELAKAGGEVGGKFLDTSQNTGLAIEQLLLYKIAAEQSGSSLSQFTSGIEITEKRLQEAASGNKELSKVFKALGVDAKQAAKDPEAAFNQLFSTIAKIEDPILRVKVATEIAGRSGAELISSFVTLNEDGDKLKERMRELGIAFGQDAAKGADAVTDELVILGAVADRVKVKVANDAGPAIVNAIQLIENAAAKSAPILSDFAVGVTLELTKWAGVLGLIGDLYEGLAGKAQKTPAVPTTLQGGIAAFAAEGAASPAKLKLPGAEDPYKAIRDSLLKKDRGGGGDNLEKAQREADLAIARAYADQKIAIYKGIEAKGTQELEAALEDRRISTKDYYERVGLLAKTSNEAEIKAEQDKVDAIEANIAKLQKGGVTKKEKVEIDQDKAKSIGIVTKIIELQDRADVESLRRLRAQTAAYKELQDAAEGYKDKLNELTGGIVVSGEDKIIKDIERLTVNGLAAGADAAQKVLDISRARAGASRAGEKVDLRQQQLNLEVQKIQNDVTLGVIGEGEARDKVLALQREAGGELQRLLSYQLQLEETAKDPAAVEKIKQQIEALRQLGQDELTLLRNRAAGGFTDPAFRDTAKQEAEKQRLLGAQSLATQIINLEDQIAHAGEDSAARVRKAQLEAILEIRDADTKAAEERIANQERLKQVLSGTLKPDQINDGLLKFLAEQKSLQQAFQDLRTGAVKDAFGGVDQVIDKIAGKLGIAGSAVAQFAKDLARLALTKGLDKLLGLSSANGGVKGAIADALGIKTAASTAATAAANADPNGVRVATNTDQINIKLDQIIALLRDQVAAARDSASCCRSSEERAASAQGPSLLSTILGAAVSGFVGGLTQGFLNGGGSGGGGDESGGGYIKENPVILPVRRRAKGGSAIQGQAYIVGDGGEPELFFPGASGTIVPASKARKLAGADAGGGSVTNNISVNVNVQNKQELNRQTRDQVLSQVARELQRAQQRNG